MGARATRRRYRAPQRRSNAPQSSIGKMIQDYYLTQGSIDFTGLASGGDIDRTIVDNSATYANSILKWAKLTIRPIYDAVDMRSGVFDCRTLYMAVYKRDQDDSSVPALDSQEVIREMRLKKELIRGPWLVTTPSLASQGFLTPMVGHMKPIVLKKFVLDREEDLRISMTNMSTAFAATSQVLTFYLTGFVRQIK